MKKYTIIKANPYEPEYETDQLRHIISAVFTGSEDMQVSDGYHTMDELYEHRIALWIALCRQIRRDQNETGTREFSTPTSGAIEVWRSKLHDDGTAFDGWFVLGIGKKKGEIMTYHLPNSRWDKVSFAETLERAPEWDGHTAADVLERLKTL